MIVTHCVQLGHLKCNHGVWLTIGNVLANGTSNLLPLVSSVAEESLFRWMRAAELTCDRCADCPSIAVHVLMTCPCIALEAGSGVAERNIAVRTPAVAPVSRAAKFRLLLCLLPDFNDIDCGVSITKNLCKFT